MIAIAVVASCLGVPIAMGLLFLRAWSLQSRVAQTEYFLRTLSTAVESYRQEYGSYPHSLEDAKTNRALDTRWHELFQQTLDFVPRNAWGDVYCYKPTTNGFVITVTGPEMAPAGWFGKKRRIEKKYAIGEALGLDQTRDEYQTANASTSPHSEDQASLVVHFYTWDSWVMTFPKELPNTGLAFPSKAGFVQKARSVAGEKSLALVIWDKRLRTTNVADELRLALQQSGFKRVLFKQAISDVDAENLPQQP